MNNSRNEIKLQSALPMQFSSSLFCSDCGDQLSLYSLKKKINK